METDYRSYWDKWPGGHRNPNLDSEIEEFVRYSDLSAGQKVLEVGCGAGPSPSLIVPLTSGGVFGDIHYPALRSQAAHSPGAFLQLDGTALPFRTASFDRVLSRTTVQHLPRRADVERFLAELARVLKPGGVLVLCRVANRLGGRLSLHHYLSRKHFKRWILGSQPYFNPQDIRWLLGQAERSGLEPADMRATPQAHLAPGTATRKGLLVYRCVYKMCIPLLTDNPHLYEFVDIKFVRGNGKAQGE